MAASGDASSGAATVNGTVASKIAELHPRRFFLETWRTIDAEAAQERAQHTGYDFRPLCALALAAVSLTLMEYFGSGYVLDEWLQRLGPPANEGGLHDWVWSLRGSPYYRLYQLIYWSLWRVLGYFVVPAMLIKWGFHERLQDHGLRTAGFAQHAWIYVLFYAVVLVLVVAVSFRPDFSSYYPFYKQAHRSGAELLIWELFYAAQFFALEFFFRGFWLQSCKRMLGSHAIFAMMVPYCMIHYGKPWLEALAAIIAGVVLGTLAMKTRSIWSGFLIHVSVAVSMDVAALLQGPGLPDRFLP